VTQTAELSYTNEKPGCKCDPCWQRLKRAINKNSDDLDITVTGGGNDPRNSADNKGNAPHTSWPTNTLWLIRPRVSVDPSNLPSPSDYSEIDPVMKQAVPATTTSLEAVLWHELLGHAEPGTVDESAAIRVENEGRACLASQGQNVRQRADVQ
jgi:hypothetical protein